MGGGTWEAYGGGRVLVGKSTTGTFSTIGATGGSEAVSLTVSQIPSHRHTYSSGWDNQSDGLFSGQSWEGYPGTHIVGSYDSMSTSASGGGSSHNNLQPYIVVYMYKRIA